MSIFSFSGKKRVLIVEDDTTIRNALIDILGSEGFQVSAAPNGVVALEMLETVKPRIMLIDNLMPGMNGAELIRRIRSNPKHSGIKLVGFSAMTRDIPGAIETWRKPLDIFEMLNRLDRLSKAF